MSASSDLTRALNGAIDKALTEARIVGAVVLVARDGKLVFHRAAGWSDREAGAPMHEDAIFRLASITKSFVTAAAMRIAERGLISLDAPVTRWLPDFRPALPDGTQPVITLHHLLTHTSGLSYRFLEAENGVYHALGISDGLDQPGLTLAENLTRLAQAPLLFAPGTGWCYSLAMDVIGGVLEAAVGKPLADIVREDITAPLGLADAGFAVTDPARLAVPYVDGKPVPTRMTKTVVVPLWDGSLIFSPDRTFDPTSYSSGGAGMAGTARDVLTFLEVIRDTGAPILKPQTVALMRCDQAGPQPQPPGPGWGFGYGWAVLNDPSPTATPQAKGTLQWAGSYGHSWFVDLANGLTVVALTNTTFEGMCGHFVYDIRNAVYR